MMCKYNIYIKLFINTELLEQLREETHYLRSEMENFMIEIIYRKQKCSLNTITISGKALWYVKTRTKQVTLIQHHF